MEVLGPRFVSSRVERHEPRERPNKRSEGAPDLFSNESDDDVVPYVERPFSTIGGFFSSLQTEEEVESPVASLPASSSQHDPHASALHKLQRYHARKLPPDVADQVKQLLTGMAWAGKTRDFCRDVHRVVRTCHGKPAKDMKRYCLQRLQERA